MQRRPLILITNDDGYEADGIRVLHEALDDLGEVVVVAPSGPMSAVSHSISLYRPVRYEEVGRRKYAVDGTPVDSVIIALNQVLPRTPDLVVSGINNGANLGHNVFYSGTVAAAMEGTFHGIPSVAISRAFREGATYDDAASFMHKLARFVVEHGLPHGVTLNVNVPHSAPCGVRLTHPAHRHNRKILVEPHKEGEGYWIREWVDVEKLDENSDHHAVRNGLISITPIAVDFPEYPAIEALDHWIHSLNHAHSS